MGFFAKDKGAVDSEYFKLENKVGKLGVGNMVNVVLTDDCLELKNKLDLRKLKYDQITDVTYGLVTDIIESSKKKGNSVIGRAIAGGILFQTTGVIVVPLSTGHEGPAEPKRETRRRIVLVISFKDSSGGDSFISLEDTRHHHGRRVANELMEIAKIDGSETDESEFL
jgi:hypothetical protein